MNKAWSAQQKRIQMQLRKPETYAAGMETLFTLRRELRDTLFALRHQLNLPDFAAMPYPDAHGSRGLTIAFSLWHMFRIEDIVAHTLICGDAEIFLRQDWQQRTGSPIITTGNELSPQEIAAFSAQLDVDALYAYCAAVQESTEQMLRALPFTALKEKIPDARRETLRALGVVSEDAEAVWLIDYWCGKDIRGLIQMPFSRHWILHTEGCLRMRDKILQAHR